MKKVRFESPNKGVIFNRMEERECHSPRPFTERQVYTNAPDIYTCSKVLPYSNDPVQLFECSNSSPYPTMNKTKLLGQSHSPQWTPCNDLELSMLDATSHEPRKPTFNRSILKPSNAENNSVDMNISRNVSQNKLPTLSASGKAVKPPNVLVRDDDFFIKKDNLDRIYSDINPIQQHLKRITIDKENNPLAKKAQIIQMSALTQTETNLNGALQTSGINSDCRCHHCVKNISANICKMDSGPISYQHHYVAQKHTHCTCDLPPVPSRCSCCNYKLHSPNNPHQTHSLEQFSGPKMNAVDKKTWAIEKYEQSKKCDSMEVEKQTNVTKEKREPTVSDLFKIIKLQNEQLQLLQEKVDKFISASQHTVPVKNCMTEHVAIETVGNQQHKISIGVMTSFEMVRTSTVINKEVVKNCDNAQIQCNRSQISIKEVLSKSQSPNLNFLDGITPVSKPMPEPQCNGDVSESVIVQHGVNEEKTLNELSLYNVQIDNATTPLMSPEQTLYLDVRDYSDSEAGSDDPSNVGWTYYNKVMTHVNGMLQDSDMPSSASALYRNTRQQMQTVQMQIDKTNVSVTKRVKFGDDPLGIQQPHIYAASTDTSLKMNQLAAKYLKHAPSAPAPPRPAPRSTAAPIDMSFATRNYMERHKLLQDIPGSSKPSSPVDMPRFLDITTLKKQPKFL